MECYFHFNLLRTSSLGFGSYVSDSRAINTWFPYESVLIALTLAAYVKSLAHSSIGTTLPIHPSCDERFRLRVLVGIWFQVLFHRPHRAAFHLSLTVLVHYRSSNVFSLTRIVLVASSKVILPRSTQDR